MAQDKDDYFTVISKTPSLNRIHFLIRRGSFVASIIGMVTSILGFYIYNSRNTETSYDLIAGHNGIVIVSPITGEKSLPKITTDISADKKIQGYVVIYNHLVETMSDIAIYQGDVYNSIDNEINGKEGATPGMGVIFEHLTSNARYVSGIKVVVTQWAYDILNIISRYKDGGDVSADDQVTVKTIEDNMPKLEQQLRSIIDAKPNKRSMGDFIIPSAFAQAATANMQRATIDDMRPYIMIGVLTSISIFFFLCTYLLFVSTDPEKIKFADNMMRTIVGFYTGIATGLLGLPGK